MSLPDSAIHGVRDLLTQSPRVVIACQLDHIRRSIRPRAASKQISLQLARHDEPRQFCFDRRLHDRSLAARDRQPIQNQPLDVDIYVHKADIHFTVAVLSTTRFSHMACTRP